ncbi:MAG: hypothetical protein WBD32_15860 [Acidobacteriaceae bacterium]|jgi:hypothetical protein
MMTRHNTILATLAVLCSFCAAPLYAQVDSAARFTTSFPFYVGNKQLPPGTYRLTTMDLSTSVLLIAGADARESAFAGYIPSRFSDPAAAGEVVFNVYGNHDFLSSITIPGDLSGAELLPSKMERRAANAEHLQASNRFVALRSYSGM